MPTTRDPIVYPPPAHPPREPTDGAFWCPVCAAFGDRPGRCDRGHQVYPVDGWRKCSADDGRAERRGRVSEAVRVLVALGADAELVARAVRSI